MKKSISQKILLLVALFTLSGCELNFSEKPAYSFSEVETSDTDSTISIGSSSADDVQGFLDSWAKSMGGKSFTASGRTFAINSEATILQDSVIPEDVYLVKIDADSATYYYPGSGGDYAAAYYKFNITSSKINFIFVSYKEDGSINFPPGVLTHEI